MQYAIELYYDKQTEGQLMDLAKKVAEEKISTKFLEWKTRPHLTLACFNDVDEAGCTEKLTDFDASGWEWYCPDRWVPHCTIALTGDDEENAFFRASDLLLHSFQKLCGEFTSIGLVKITFPVEEIFTADLKH